MTDLPFWSDDFDMDLPKVLPAAREVVGDLAGVELFTHGNTTHGRLNSPSAWNHHAGMVAFFGFHHPCKHPSYYTSDPVVSCTFWEALRDLWAHHCLMSVESRSIWDSGVLARDFDAIMWNLRGWGDGAVTDARADQARCTALNSITYAVGRFRMLHRSEKR